MTLEELGALLRAERERRGLNIEDVSAHLKISVRKLRALEDGDTSSMPHPAYVKGFVRSYATYLGMATSEVVEAMQVVSRHMPETTEDHARPVRRAPATSSSGKSSGKGSRLLLVAAGLAVLAGGSYGVWKSGFLETLRGHQEAVMRPSLPMQDDARPDYKPAPSLAPAEPAQTAPAPAEAKPAAAPAPAPTATATPATTASPVPATSPAPGSTAATAQAPATPEKVLVRTGDADPVSTTPSAQENDVIPPGQHKIVITATETCWIRSTADRTDTRQFSLGKGDTFALTFSQRLDLKLGNAGGVRIRYNGKDFPIGAKSGQVRTLVFPPKN